jgi:addiction module HigA family antidote
LYYRQAIDWKCLKGIGKASTAFGSMTESGSVSFGRMVIAMKSKSSTITHKRTPVGRLSNIHPGEVLLEEFLKPMGISAYKLAKETNLSQTRISEIIHRRRGITAETALRFSKFFGNTAEFWLGLQNDYDLEENRLSLRKELEAIKSMAELKAANG